jgi:outer membrane receptor protein involved in Fe transport
MRSVQPVDVRVSVRPVLCAALLCGGAPSAVADQAEVTPFGEVVVTAQKREQNIQDVGIAVTPLGEEYRVYAFDSSLFSGVVASVYAKPRTYGLTASFRFGAGYQ